MSGRVRGCPTGCGNTITDVTSIVCGTCYRRVPGNVRLQATQAWDAMTGSMTVDAYRQWTAAVAETVKAATPPGRLHASRG